MSGLRGLPLVALLAALGIGGIVVMLLADGGADALGFALAAYPLCHGAWRLARSGS